MCSWILQDIFADVTVTDKINFILAIDIVIIKNIRSGIIIGVDRKMDSEYSKANLMYKWLFNYRGRNEIRRKYSEQNVVVSKLEKS